LIIYALCIPLAVWIGYLLAAPADRGTFGIGGIMLLALCTPILLRWHHPLLVACWNLPLTVFFLPGSPQIWMLMVALSLGISILHRTINSEMRFLSVPSVTWPLIFLLAVVVFTAKLTGGVGLKSMGSGAVGGKRYVYLFVAILGYFALTARRIPVKSAGLYIALFYLGSCASVIGDLAPYVPRPLWFIFAFFPASGYDMSNGQGTGMQIERFAGVAGMSWALCALLAARYGLRGIFLAGRPWRAVLFLMFCAFVFFGGFRLYVVGMIVVFTLQFFLERLYRTGFFPVLIFAGLIATMFIIPFADKLPLTFQRSLSFLPLKIDPMVRRDAEASSEWRIKIWQVVLPDVPQYLLLGKGYSVSAVDFQNQNTAVFSRQADASNWAATIAGDYHNGPLSVIIFFGIWGCIAIIWFWIASLRVLYRNYRYGDPALNPVNTFLLALFIWNILCFLIIFGSLYSDMVGFVAIIGLSVSLNGGIRLPVPRAVRAREKAVVAPRTRPQFQPFYPH
jgi:hypothetical protein